MARKTSENKTGVAEKAAAAEVKTAAAEKAASTTENKTAPSSKPLPKTEKGLQFNVLPNGLVGVISEKRAGKSVIGTTGDIITFDGKGYAEVKAEDARHFSQIPDFSFKLSKITENMNDSGFIGKR